MHHAYSIYWPHTHNLLLTASLKVRHAICAAVQRGMNRRGLCLIYCPVLAVVKFLTILEQGAPHFHFALDPTNYVVGPAKSFWGLVHVHFPALDHGYMVLNFKNLLYCTYVIFCLYCK